MYPKECSFLFENCVFEPEVYLIGYQTIDRAVLELFKADEGINNFKTDAPSDSEEMIEIAGRLCYNSFISKRPGGNKEYIKHIIEVMHGSVLEHAVYNFIITGISRYIHSELIRHRTKSFSIRSTRYVDESKGKFVVPLEIYNDTKAFEEFKAVAEKSLETYKSLYETTYRNELICYYLELSEENKYSMFKDISTKELEKDIPVSAKTDARKYARGLARAVLPGCLETKVFLTTNARSLRNFLELRANSHADKEIRLLANKMFDKVEKKTPNIFADYTKVYLHDNTFELVTNYRKV